MSIPKRLGLGLAIVAAAVLAVVAISQVSASFDNIIMERATVEPGHSATVDLLADDIDEPGLGAGRSGSSTTHQSSVLSLVRRTTAAFAT